MPRLKSRLTFANVCSFLALLIALGTGSAYAANTVFSSDIVDGEVKTADLGNNSVGTTKIVNGQVANADLHADAVDSSKISDASIANADLGIDSVQAIQIADNTIDGGEIIDNSLSATDLAAGSAGNSEIATSAVDGSKVASNSITSADILGADISGHISFSLSANECGTLNLGVGGAQVGQVPLFAFTGSGSFPPKVQVTPLSVTSAGNITATACNGGSTAISVSNAPVRIMTFG